MTSPPQVTKSASNIKEHLAESVIKYLKKEKNQLKQVFDDLNIIVKHCCHPNCQSQYFYSIKSLEARCSCIGTTAFFACWNDTNNNWVGFCALHAELYLYDCPGIKKLCINCAAREDRTGDDYLFAPTKMSGEPTLVYNHYISD